MKKLMIFVTLLLSLLAINPSWARVNVNVGISLPAIVFAAPPEVIVLPDSDDVYVVPDIDVDIFFWSGWGWREGEGRWYRSQNYDRGWGYYRRVPSFYFDVDPGWGGYYRNYC